MYITTNMHQVHTYLRILRISYEFRNIDNTNPSFLFSLLFRFDYFFFVRENNSIVFYRYFFPSIQISPFRKLHVVGRLLSAITAFVHLRVKQVIIGKGLEFSEEFKTVVSVQSFETTETPYFLPALHLRP